MKTEWERQVVSKATYYRNQRKFENTKYPHLETFTIKLPSLKRETRLAYLVIPRIVDEQDREQIIKSIGAIYFGK